MRKAGPCLTVLALVGLVLTACSGDPEATEQPAETGTATTTASAEATAAELSGAEAAENWGQQDEASSAEPVINAQAIRDVDFGNQTWSYNRTLDPEQANVFQTVDGVGVESELSRYLVLEDEIIFSDANGDGIEEALVPIQEGPGENHQNNLWYIWALDPESGDPVQSNYPVAQATPCGTDPGEMGTAEGGFSIQMYQHSDSQSCAERGSIEDFKTVGAYFDDAGVLWPAQIEPEIGFGGMCSPSPDPIDYYPRIPALAIDQFYAAPTDEAPAQPTSTITSWSTRLTPQRDTPRNWQLVDVIYPDQEGEHKNNFGCVWVKKQPWAQPRKY